MMQELTLAQANDFFENHLDAILEKLQPGLTPLWGRMSPQHAIEHLAWTLRASNGKEHFAVFTPVEKLPKFKQFLHHNLAIMHNYKSPIMDKEQLPALKHADLATAVEAFRAEWSAFEAFFKNNPAATPNNAVYGALTEEEWRRFHFKHFVHHLAQFGVTTSEAHGLTSV
jgi:oxepin-CoA hydrolase/3-oxo-5,6-dehydrosuberyl-CoA semialdehyde dehydrogenase